MPLEHLIPGLSNWRAIAKTTRQEFNDAAAPMRNYLLAEIKELGSGWHSPSTDERNLFLSKLTWFKRRRFMKVYRRQRSERGDNFRQDYTTGECYYENTETIVKYLKECLSFTEPR